jgi:chromosome segregation ATPase
MAKMFLHSSKPQDKYMFFLKGTQLSQLYDEYGEILQQIDTIKRIVKSKKERLDDLKTVMNEAKSKWKKIEENKNVEITIKKLKNELAWTHVVEIEEASWKYSDLHLWSLNLNRVS